MCPTFDPAEAAPTYFDCDTGVDDALALLLLAHQDRLDVRGIGAVSGNVSAAQAARNTLDLLPLIGLDAPVAVGAATFLAGPFVPAATPVHGANGLGGVHLPASAAEAVSADAADLLFDLAREHGGTLRIIATGPLTNIAIAAMRYPQLVALIRDVTVMAGAASVPGNITASAEANVYADPEAAAFVFQQPWPITMVGLDTTMDNRLSEPGRIALASSSNRGTALVGEMLDSYADFYTGIYGVKECALHDPLAVAIAANLVAVDDAPILDVTVDTSDGPSRGRTICDQRGRFRGHPRSASAHASVVMQTENLEPVLLGQILRH